MIHTSNGESYEDAVDQFFGHDMMQSASTTYRRGVEAPTEPAGAFKSSGGTSVAQEELDRQNTAYADTVESGKDVNKPIDINDKLAQQRYYDFLTNEDKEMLPAYSLNKGNIPVGELSSKPSKNIEDRTKMQGPWQPADIGDIAVDLRNRDLSAEQQSVMKDALGSDYDIAKSTLQAKMESYTIGKEKMAKDEAFLDKLMKKKGLKSEMK